MRRYFISLLLSLSFLGGAVARAQETAQQVIPNWPAPAFWAHSSLVAGATGSARTLPHRMESLGQESVQGTSSPLPFIAVTPCRVFDTRSTTPITGGTERDFTIAGFCEIPAVVSAVSFNFTVVNNFGEGFLTVFPAGTTRPSVSTLNWGPSTGAIANAAVVSLGAGGAITAFVATSTSDLIVDVNGYYGGGAGTANTFLGFSAGNATLTSNSNTGIGVAALASNTTGSGNTAIGIFALSKDSGGSGNTATGANALFSNTTGGNNVALGVNAGFNLTTGSNNIDIGNAGIAAESDTIRIGTSGTHARSFLAGVRDVTTDSADGLPVLIDSSGQLGTLSSSASVKREIADVGDASSALLKLRPVSFFYRNDMVGIRQYGLIAEEVAKVYPDLVANGRDGRPETVRYHFLVPMLLNEVQKDRKTITDLKARLERLEALMPESIR